jgi:soluble lytic murein transglycosylase-like protein
LVILFSYFIPNKITARAEDRIPTFDKEITRLAKQYSVNEKKIRAIIMCESANKEYAINHNLDKDGKIWSSDYGLLQVNSYFHEDKMESLGLSIRNPYDSLEYGFMLMSKYGDKPWSASRNCWTRELTLQV